MIYGVNDVASLAVEEYGRPGRKNFPSIDAAIRLPGGRPLAEGLGTEYTFLQIIVNISHGVKWPYLKELMDGVHTKEVALVFVVTEQEFEQYREQK
jgi:hypothetical protein